MRPVPAMMRGSTRSEHGRSSHASIAKTPVLGLRSPRVAMQFSAVNDGVQFVQPRYLQESSWVDSGSVVYLDDVPASG